MSKEKTYHLSEIFTSVQGEGEWVGQHMTFIRMAGCSVGKPTQHEYLEKCQTYDGREFLCDTNFKRRLSLTTSEIVGGLEDVQHICITGGEPFNHDLTELIKAIYESGEGKTIHIETSGTVQPPDNILYDDSLWITVSPKMGYIPIMVQRANEIKLLVDKNFKLSEADEVVRIAGDTKVMQHFGYHFAPTIWLSPVNDEMYIDMVNIKCALQIIDLRPDWRLSLQMHKVIGVR